MENFHSSTDILPKINSACKIICVHNIDSDALSNLLVHQNNNPSSIVADQRRFTVAMSGLIEFTLSVFTSGLP